MTTILLTLAKKAEGDCIGRQAAIDAMKDMYRAAEKWLRDATDDVTKARAESCMATLVEIKLRIDKTMGKGTLTDDDCMEAAKSVLGEDDLPAVQPDHTADVSKKVKRTDETAQNVSDSDLVSREAAIEAIAKQMPRSYTPDGSHPADEEIFRAQEVIADCIEALEILPSAQPEIIRCKDCKYMIDTGDDLMCDNAKGWVVATTSDFGCVLAERRTE